MGRKQKFGEESAWVSVRVPKSKVKEYRLAVRQFVEIRFALKMSFEGDSALLMIYVPKERAEEYKIAIERLISDKMREEQETIGERVLNLPEDISRSKEGVREER